MRIPSGWRPACIAALAALFIFAVGSSSPGKTSSQGIQPVWQISIASDLPEGFDPARSTLTSRFGVSSMVCGGSACYFVLEIGVPRDLTAEEKKKYGENPRPFWMNPGESTPAKGTTSASRVIAVDRDTGQRLWTSPLAGTDTRDIYLTPGGLLLVTSFVTAPDYSGHLRFDAFDSSTGRLLWQRASDDDQLRGSPFLPSRDSKEIYWVTRNSQTRNDKADTALLEALDIQTGRVLASDTISSDFDRLFTVDGQVYITLSSNGDDIYSVDRTDSGFAYLRLSQHIEYIGNSSADYGRITLDFRSDCVVSENFFESDYTFSCVDFATGRNKWKVNKDRTDYKVEADRGYAVVSPYPVEGKQFAVINMKDGQPAWTDSFKRVVGFLPIGDYLAVIAQIDNPAGPSPRYLIIYRALTGAVVGLAPLESIFQNLDDKDTLYHFGPAQPAPDGFLYPDKRQKTVTYFRITPQEGLSLPVFQPAKPERALAHGSPFFAKPVWQVSYADLGIGPEKDQQTRISSLDCYPDLCIVSAYTYPTAAPLPSPKSNRFGTTFKGPYGDYWPMNDARPLTYIGLDPASGRKLWSDQGAAPFGATIYPQPSGRSFLLWSELSEVVDPKNPKQVIDNRGALIDNHTGEIVRMLRPRAGKLFLPAANAGYLLQVDSSYFSPGDQMVSGLWAYRLSDGAMYGYFPLPDANATLFVVDGQPFVKVESTGKVYSITISESAGVVAREDPHSLAGPLFGYPRSSSFWFTSDCVKIKTGEKEIQREKFPSYKQPIVSCLNWKTGELKEQAQDAPNAGAWPFPGQKPRPDNSAFKMFAIEAWYQADERGGTIQVQDLTGLVIWQKRLKDAHFFGPFGPFLIYSTPGVARETQIEPDDYRMGRSFRQWRPAILHLVDLRVGAVVDEFSSIYDESDVKFYAAPGGVVADFGDAIAKFVFPK